jgi:hypothetical protein
MGKKLRFDMTLPNGQPLRFDMGPQFRWDGEVPANSNLPTTPRMPSQNLIAASITQVLADELIADIAALRENQEAFLLALSAEAKQDLAKMGAGNLALDAIIRAAATENAGELASNFPLADWDQDRAFAATYRPWSPPCKSWPAMPKTPCSPRIATPGRPRSKPTATSSTRASARRSTKPARSCASVIAAGPTPPTP